MATAGSTIASLIETSKELELAAASIQGDRDLLVADEHIQKLAESCQESPATTRSLATAGTARSIDARTVRTTPWTAAGGRPSGQATGCPDPPSSTRGSFGRGRTASGVDAEPAISPLAPCCRSATTRVKAGRKVDHSQPDQYSASPTVLRPSTGRGMLPLGGQLSGRDQRGRRCSPSGAGQFVWSRHPARTESVTKSRCPRPSIRRRRCPRGSCPRRSRT